MSKTDLVRKVLYLPSLTEGQKKDIITDILTETKGWEEKIIIFISENKMSSNA